MCKSIFSDPELVISLPSATRDSLRGPDIQTTSGRSLFSSVGDAAFQ
jgi:hypothetical protein